MDEILGLDANVQTALTLIVTGIIVPAVTSLLKQPNLPKWARRAIPIGLSALGALIIVLLQAGGPFAEQLITWLLILATIVGIAQALYSLMPSVWTKLEASTTPNTHRADRPHSPPK